MEGGKKRAKGGKKRAKEGKIQMQEGKSKRKEERTELQRPPCPRALPAAGSGRTSTSGLLPLSLLSPCFELCFGIIFLLATVGTRQTPERPSQARRLACRERGERRPSCRRRRGEPTPPGPSNEPKPKTKPLRGGRRPDAFDRAIK